MCVCVWWRHAEIRQHDYLTVSKVQATCAMHVGDYFGFLCGIRGVVINNTVGCMGLKMKPFHFSHLVRTFLL